MNKCNSQCRVTTIALSIRPVAMAWLAGFDKGFGQPTCSISGTHTITPTHTHTPRLLSSAAVVVQSQSNRHLIHFQQMPQSNLSLCFVGFGFFFGFFPLRAACCPLLQILFK